MGWVGLEKEDWDFFLEKMGDGKEGRREERRRGEKRKRKRKNFSGRKTWRKCDNSDLSGP